ncbi:MAG: peptide chain release factor N(5)-glutamine methyltransferase [Rhodoferax sp.]|nr:peptide chain release factor N(5)-glutamine methyltransferase [Rhodoferax sp.]
MTPTVAGALAEARRRGVDRLDVQLLLGAMLGKSRAWLIAHDDAPLDAAQVARLNAALEARADGVPLAYLTGEQIFCGLPLSVGPGVLVPRPETEGLVDWALACLQGRADVAVADLGTGSGAIALAIKSARPSAQVAAVERSPEALAMARANGARLQLEVDWCAGHWWQPLAGRQFDLVVANPPYVAAGDPHLTALRHEPTSALVAGSDGLDDLRQIIAEAPPKLRPGGWLLLEHGHDQGPATRQLLAAAGFIDVSTRQDLAGLDRCSGGRTPEMRVEKG